MNRKIAQILSIFVFAEFICTGCRMKKTYDEIPFVQGISVTPIVEADMGDAILLFRIDTGSEDNILFRSGADRLYGSAAKYEEENIYPELKKIGKTDVVILYKDISAFYASDSRLSFSASAGYVQKSMRFKNDLGCPLWLNHCIQLDFEHMQFRIK